MAQSVIMPKQGITVESCIITTWYKKEGDTVNQGDLLFGYETDKATFDCESTAGGTLLKILFADGEEVPVLADVCVIGEPGEDVSAFTASSAVGEAEAPVEEVAEVTTQTAPAKNVTTTVTADGEYKISPRARKFAEDKGIDAKLAAPTGPNGRIIERDVRELASNTPSTLGLSEGVTGTGMGGRVRADDLSRVDERCACEGSGDICACEYEEVKLTGIRKAISKAMITSLATTAQLTNTSSFDATAIIECRKMLKSAENITQGVNVTIGDILLYAISRVIVNHPDLNAHLNGDVLRRFGDVHLGMAVDTPRGLIVPTIRYANKKSLIEIAKETKELAKSAQEGTISPDLITATSATFTISNLGTFGVESFTPVINPPQTGILGVNTIVTRVKDVGGVAVPYPSIPLSLTYDHRVIDGAPAGRFAKELCSALEHFTALLIKG